MEQQFLRLILLRSFEDGNLKCEEVHIIYEYLGETKKEDKPGYLQSMRILEPENCLCEVMICENLSPFFRLTVKISVLTYALLMAEVFSARKKKNRILQTLRTGAQGHPESSAPSEAVMRFRAAQMRYPLCSSSLVVSSLFPSFSLQELNYRGELRIFLIYSVIWLGCSI